MIDFIYHLFYLCFFLLFSFVVFIFLKKIVSTDSVFLPSVGVIVSFCYFILVPVAILTITGSLEKRVFVIFPDIPDLHLENAILPTMYALVVGILIVYVCYYLSAIKKWGRVRSDNELNYRAYIMYAGALYALFFLLDVILSGLFAGEGHWYRSRHDAIEDSSYPMLLIGLLYLRNAIRLVYFGLVIGAWANGKLGDVKFSVLYLVPVLLDVYLSGNRFILASTALLIFIVLMMRKRYALIFISALIAVPVVVAGTVYMQVRQEIHSADRVSIYQLFSEKGANSDLEFKSVLTNAVEGINYNTFVAVTDIFPRDEGFLLGETFIKPFLAWIPRSVWSDKPKRLSQIVGYRVTGSEYVTIVTSLPGELWANFGYIGIVFVPLVVFVILFLSKLVIVKIPFYGYIGFIAVFASARAAFAAIVLELLILGLLVSLLVSLVEKKVVFFGRVVKLRGLK